MQDESMEFFFPFVLASRFLSVDARCRKSSVHVNVNVNDNPTKKHTHAENLHSLSCPNFFWVTTTELQIIATRHNSKDGK